MACFLIILEDEPQGILTTVPYCCPLRCHVSTIYHDGVRGVICDITNFAAGLERVCGGDGHPSWCLYEFVHRPLGDGCGNRVSWYEC